MLVNCIIGFLIEIVINLVIILSKVHRNTRVKWFGNFSGIAKLPLPLDLGFVLLFGRQKFGIC